MEQQTDMNSPPLAPHTLLPDFVSALAASAPSREAMVFRNERWTYAELESEIVAASRMLLAMGVGPGDRVAMLAPPRPEFWVIFLATISLGAIWIGLNSTSRKGELEFILTDAKPAALITLSDSNDDALDLDRLRMSAGVAEERFVKLDSARSARENLSGLNKRVESAPCFKRVHEINAADAALLVYTSGSTGKPKGALISHYGLGRGSEIQARHFGVDAPRVICNLPVSHVGCVADTCATTLAGGGAIIFQETFDPVLIARAIETERVSIVGGVPTMLLALLALPEFAAADLSSVKLVIWAGAAMPKYAIEALAALGLRMKTAYGMTETSLNVTFTANNASIDDLAETVGRPVDEVGCRLADPDTDNLVQPGDPGELQFYGPTNFIGYFEQPSATKSAFTKDGWLKTGDLAMQDSSGAIRIVGRLREMYKSGGYSVYPREIEIVLEDHPDVAQAAVVAAADHTRQEAGAAFIVLEQHATASTDDLTAYLASRLANYKIPKSIHIRDALPKLPIGKVDKAALRALLRGSVS